MPRIRPHRREERTFALANVEVRAVNAFLGLGALAHTGVVPGTTSPEPSEATRGAAA